MNNVRTGAYVAARVGSLVRWTHPKGLTNGVVIEVRNEGQEAFIHWFDHEEHLLREVLRRQRLRPRLKIVEESS